MMKELGLDPKTSSRDTLQQERAGHHIYASDFYVHVKGQRAQKVRISYDAIQKAAKLDEKELEELIEYNNRRYCEHARLREAKDEPVTEDETVLEPDERGVLRPKGLPKVDGGDEFWQ
jgi:hypothetical protein